MYPFSVKKGVLNENDCRGERIEKKNGHENQSWNKWYFSIVTRKKTSCQYAAKIEGSTRQIAPKRRDFKMSNEVIVS